MVNYEDKHHNIRKTITVTEFRRWMAHYIAMVRYGDDWVCIKRRGMDPVYLVSKADMDLIWKASDELAYGPVEPETGYRSGRGFMYWVRESLRLEKESGGTGKT
jgi:prevent-host-death family protein